jgi:hypothetical protein
MTQLEFVLQNSGKRVQGRERPHARRGGRLFSDGDLKCGGDCRPCRRLQSPGATAPIADSGGTYSAAGATAPTTDPAGTYSSPYALNRLFLEAGKTTPANAVLSFHSATVVTNYYGATSSEASLAKEFFTNYAGTSAATLLS